MNDLDGEAGPVVLNGIPAGERPGAVLLMPGVTLAAAYLPARRPASLDPLAALREE